MKNGSIIFINGTSSSGKTSIVHALQNLLEKPFHETGIDKFIWCLPERILDRPMWDDVFGLADKAGMTGHDLVWGMHHVIEALSKAGRNVIADQGLVKQAWANECAPCFLVFRFT